MDASGKPIGPARVWLQHSWVPGLAMSRALGDAVAHSVGVSSKPDTAVTELTPQVSRPKHFDAVAGEVQQKANSLQAQARCGRWHVKHGFG